MSQNSRLSPFFVGILLLTLPLAFGDWLREVDLSLFSALNPMLGWSTNLTKALAWMNSSYGDILADGLMIASLFLAPGLFRDKCRWLLFALVLMLVVQILFNHAVFHYLLRLEHPSPTYFLTPVVDLAKFWPLPGNKSLSLFSFPADHATTLLLSYLIVARVGGSRFIAASVALFFMLPRLFAGAHGITDILFGSVGVTLIFAPLTNYLPKYEKTYLKSGA